MNHILRIVDSPEEGVYILDVRQDFVTYENQRWYICTSRVKGRCSQTGIEYPAGTLVYRPTGNPGNRHQRFLPEAFAAIGCAPAETTETRECDTCHVTLPLTVTHFAHPHNRKYYRTTCRACVNIERHAQKLETQRRKKEKLAEHIASGARIITFPDNWKPNREGIRNTMKDYLGICSGMG